MAAPIQHLHPARRLLVALVLALAALPAAASVGLETDGGQPLRWFPQAFPITYVIHAGGSADVADLSDHLAVRRSVQAWSGPAGAAVSFAELTGPEQTLRIDWPSNDLHLVRFLEAPDPLLFPPGSGVVAATPLQYKPATGQLVDADILLNGAEMTFATDLSPGAFDIRSIVTHECGHVLGLGHSPIPSSSLAPYGNEGQFHVRTLLPDDVSAIESLYPAIFRGSIVGTVLREATGAPVAGAHVWARHLGTGLLAAGSLTDDLGRYAITALKPGTYELVAAPLDAPLLLAGMDVELDFQPAVGGPVTVLGALASEAPDLSVPQEASLRIAGPLTPVLVHRGETVAVKLAVMGGFVGTPQVLLAGGAADLATGTPSLGGDGGQLTFTVTAGPDTPIGAYDVRVQTAVAVTIAPGLLEVLPEAPELQSVSASCGSESGGAPLLVTGAGFGEGAELTFGDVAAPPATVLDDGTLAVDTPPGAPGKVDLTVVTSGGEQATLIDAYNVLVGAAPVIESVFPTAGTLEGGTLITLQGSGFEGGLNVSVGGEPAPIVLLQAPGTARVLSPALPEGPHDVVVSRFGCSDLMAVAPGGFTALVAADPVLTSVAPFVLAHTGGDVFRVTGEGFVPGAVVELFTDPLNGAGGVPASTTFVDEQELTAISPPGDIGPAALAVRLPDGRVAVEPGALEIVPLVDHKDRVKGVIDEAGVADVVYLDGLAFSRVSFSAKRIQGGDLWPAITILDPGGFPLVSTDPANAVFDAQLTKSVPARATIVKLPLPATGRYTVLVTGRSGTTGAYRLTIRERLLPALQVLKLPKGATFGPGPVDFSLFAKPGSTLSGKLVAKGGLSARIDALRDPAGVLRLWTEPGGELAGDAALLAAVSVGEGGSFLRFEKLPLELFGAWQLTIGAADETSGPLTGTLKIRAPKSKDVFGN